MTDSDESSDFGKHRLVVLFMRGIFRLRPAFPRYQTTWDVAPVLEKLKLIDNSLATLKQLSMKCATLLALTSGQRVQTLAAIEIHCIVEQHNKLVFHFKKMLKTSRPDFQTTIELFSFPSDDKICPVKCIKTYIERTSDLRGCSNLFISYFKPHNKVCAQTISRWIVATIRECGISKNFLAHSTRSAAVSKAKTNTDLTTIIKAAGWANSKVFAKFYNKPVESTAPFVHAVLSS